MANIRRKVINKWDGGIKTSPRDNNPETTKNAQMVKGFDVYKDSKKLIPMQSWESFTTTEEKAINFRALGGYGDTVYGVGKTMTNWYASEWLYRIQIDIDPDFYTASSPAPTLYLDMSFLPIDFWDHVKSDCTDVRLTSTDGVSAFGVHIENLDYTGMTGDMYFNGSVGTSFFIYYGNPNATALVYDKTYYYGGAFAFGGGSGQEKFAYTFGDETAGNRVWTGSSGVQEFKNVTTGMYVAGMVGSGIQTNGTVVETDYVENLYLDGTSIGVSFNFYGVWPNEKIVYNPNNYWSIQVSFTGKVVFTVSTTGPTETFTSSASVTVGAWNTIDCWYDRNGNTINIAINGVVETQAASGSSHDWQGINETLAVKTFAGKVSQLAGFTTYLSAGYVSTRRNNLIEPSFFTIGSEVSKSIVNINYGYTGLWQKSITSGNWVEVMSLGRPVRTLNFHPVNAFVDHTGTYFIVSQNVENGGFMYVAKVDSQQVIDDNNTPLTVFSSEFQAIQSERAINQTVYFNGKDYNVCRLANPSVTTDFTVPSFIQSMQAWKTYLAVAYQYIEKGFVQLWNLTPASQATEIIETGVGKIRILGKAEDILFAVIDNFIEDTVLSGNKPTMEVRQYVGNGSMQTTHVVEVPAVIPYTDFSDTWDLSITNFKIYRNTQTLFYARIPNNEAGTTFDEGFWAVGKNEDGQLSLTLQIETNFGMPENVFSIAQQVFFVAKDGGIHRLSDDTYNDISLYTTPKMNEGHTEVEKKLIGVEVVTEPLEAGQTISVYYKRNGDTTRTQIFAMSGEGEISYETTYDIDENNLPNYQEIEFDIESTGGKAGILELNYKYEYLSNIV